MAEGDALLLCRSMSIWAIADIHASRTEPATGKPVKPMDVFGPHWANHMERLEQAWTENVRADDTVLLAGDIDWALHLEDAMETLARIDRWPGRKILVRGNHDYWWSSKTTNRVRRALPGSLTLLHNNAVHVEGFAICGTKGSPVPGGVDWTAENVKLLNREEQRLLLSLGSRDQTLPAIVVLHYPPFYPAQGPSSYTEIMQEHNVVACIYGHLHAEAASAGPVGKYFGMEHYLVAADAVHFRPVLIARDGELVPPPRPECDGGLQCG